MGHNDPIVKGESFWDDAINLFCLRPVWRNRSNNKSSIFINEQDSEPKGDTEAKSEGQEEAKNNMESLWEAMNQNLEIIEGAQLRAIMQEISVLESLTERSSDSSVQQQIIDLKSLINRTADASRRQQRDTIEAFIENASILINSDSDDPSRNRINSEKSLHNERKTKS